MNAKILITDDDFIDLEIIKRHLKNENYEIFTAKSGEQAIEIFNAHRDIEVIVLDAIMPGLSGFDTSAKLKRIDPQISIILVTGLTDEKSLKHAFESGAMDFISKPAKKQEVISRICNALNIKRAEKEIKKLYKSLIDDIELARKVQSYLVSDWINVSDKLTMSTSYLPASGVSGDLYDLITLSEDKYLIYVGDISGHGVQASLIMAAIQMAIRFEVNEHHDKLEITHILNTLNKTFSERFSHMNYMTFVIGIYDAKLNTFQYFSAGHPPAITYNVSTGSIKLNQEKGSVPVGMFSHTVFASKDIDHIQLGKDEVLLLYTDGVFECNSSENKKFELDNLISLIDNIEFKSPVCFPEQVLSEIKKQSFSFDDDVTLMCLQLCNLNNNIFTYSIEPQIGYVEKIRLKLNDKLLKHNISEFLIQKIELLLVEHLNNLIEHGMKKSSEKKQKKIYLSVTTESNSIKIETVDRFEKWDFHKKLKDAKKKAEAETVNTFAISGRGLPIIDELADEIIFERFNDVSYYSFIIKE